MEAAPEPTGQFSCASFDRTLDIDHTQLSAAANELLLDAQQFCFDTGHNLVEPAHAAWVLFMGRAIKPVYESGARILARAKVDAASCEKFLQEELSLCNTEHPAKDVSYSHSFVEMLKDAVFECEAYHDTHVSFDHIAIALAIHLTTYGGHIGFNEAGFRAAAEQVRGLPLEVPTSPTDSSKSGGSMSGGSSAGALDHLAVDVGSFKWEQDVPEHLPDTSDVRSEYLDEHIETLTAERDAALRGLASLSLTDKEALALEQEAAFLKHCLSPSKKDRLSPPTDMPSPPDSPLSGASTLEHLTGFDSPTRGQEDITQSSYFEQGVSSPLARYLRERDLGHHQHGDLGALISDSDTEEDDEVPVADHHLQHPKFNANWQQLHAESLSPLRGVTGGSY